MTVKNAMREVFQRLGLSPEEIEERMNFATMNVPEAARFSTKELVKGTEEEFIQAMVGQYTAIMNDPVAAASMCQALEQRTKNKNQSN